MAETDGLAIRAAILQWQASHSDACPTLDDLVREKFMQPELTRDPWGEPYAITCDDSGASVTSAGPDKKQGTPDDVVSSSRTVK